jgi:hypothetical protein
MPVNRNLLFMIIGALVVAVGVLSYNLYQDRKRTVFRLTLVQTA